MEKVKSKKPKIILEQKTHFGVFALPAIIFVFMIWYVFTTPLETNSFFYLLVFIVIFLKSLSMYYKKKIVITDKKIYIYTFNKKLISWSLIEDFSMVNYTQTKAGKFFNYGTLTLINKNKEMYEYYFLNDIYNTYQTIINSYEKLMKKLDPNFIVSYINTKTDKLDTLDKIDNTNEK